MRAAELKGKAVTSIDTADSDLEIDPSSFSVVGYKVNSGGLPGLIGQWMISRGMAAATVAALLFTSLVACASEQSSSQSEVAGVGSDQAMTPTPATMSAGPAATPTPTVGDGIPAATPTPAAPVPPAITRALADIYANVDWFQGVVTVITNPGAADSTSMTLRQWFKKPNMVKLEVIRASGNMVPVGSTFVATTLQEAQATAGFPILQPATLPSGASRQAVRSGTFNNRAVVAFFYGDTPENISTVLIERPARPQLPVLRGAELVNLDGVTADVYQTRDMVAVDWVRGDTSLTLATTLTREQALDIARSAR